MDRMRRFRTATEETAMTFAEQTNALEQFGYTVREASFLVTAALHSGYFVSANSLPTAAR